MKTAVGVIPLASLAVLVAAVVGPPACSARDCDEERAGQVRCVSNRIELCNEDGTLSYESCSAQGLVCSEALKACVTEQVAMSGSGGSDGGAGGAGGAGGS